MFLWAVISKDLYLCVYIYVPEPLCMSSGDLDTEVNMI